MLRTIRRALTVSALSCVVYSPLALSGTVTVDLRTPDTSFIAGSSTRFTLDAEAFPIPFPGGFSVTSLGFNTTIDFGDGTIQSFDDPLPSFLAIVDRHYSFEHLYSSPGTYVVRAFVDGSMDIRLDATVPVTLTDLFEGTDELSLTVTAAIPEPETYAMLIAGLLLLGFATKRRQTASPRTRDVRHASRAAAMQAVPLK